MHSPHGLGLFVQLSASSIAEMNMLCDIKLVLGAVSV